MGDDRCQRYWQFCLTIWQRMISNYEMIDAQREILQEVASGNLSPQEAAARLQELEAGRQPAGSGETAAAASSPPSTRVRVQASMGSVRVIGDASVREAVAEGPHQARREGETLVVESNSAEGHGFAFGGGRFNFRFNEVDRQLIVRMNPALALDLECQAGSLRVEGVHAPIRATAHAGSVRIVGFTHPIDLEVQAGSVRASGLISSGSSRVRCHAGSVRLELDPASSVRISARSTLGRITLPDAATVAGMLGAATSGQLGAGEADLSIESEMGSVNVSVAP